MKSSKIVIVFIIFFILVGVVFALLSIKKNQNIQENQNRDFSLIDSLTFVKEINGDEYNSEISKDEEMKIISGQIKKIEEGRIVLSVHILNSEDDPDLKERIIEFNKDVKIYKRKAKNEKQFIREVKEFETIVNNSTDKNEVETGRISIPESFTREDGTFDDVKEGDFVNVVSLSNIREAKNIQVVEISILHK